MDGDHTSLTSPPDNIEPIDSDDIQDDSDDEEEENEYGDMVTVKGKEFVVCTGLVVP